MTTNTEKQVWDYNTDLDTAKSFEVFKLFRDAGHGRSLKAIAQQYNRHEGVLRRWSARGRWFDRAAAYDAYLDQKTRQANEKQAVEIHRQKLEKYRETCEQLGWQMLYVGQQAIEVVAGALRKYVNSPELLEEMRPLDIKSLATSGVSVSEIGERFTAQALAVEKVLDWVADQTEEEDTEEEEQV